MAFPEGSGEPNEQTTSRAYVDEVGWPVVEVKTFNHPVWLLWLEPVPQL